MKLLLIDDDQLDRMTAVRALRQSNQVIQVVEAVTAEDGIERLGADRYDAVLLDYRLPDCNGLEALKRIRSMGLSDTAVIMLSGYEDDELAAQCIAQGAQDFLLKQELSSRHLLRSIAYAKQRYQLELELRKSHEKLNALAQQDKLTGLGNRYLFDNELRSTLLNARSNQSSFALLLLDLDNFKVVNDTLGHDVGDKLLKVLAERLNQEIQEEDLLCRLGGDEFVVIRSGSPSEAEINDLAKRLIKAITQEVQIVGTTLSITTSIGIAMYPDKTYSRDAVAHSDEIMKFADIALYQAKGKGRDQAHYYSPELHDQILRRTQFEDELKHAVERNQFRLHFQPQLTPDGEIRGLEALIRWQHPTLGLLMPNDFIHFAEETGTIVDIGTWVLSTACQQIADWHHQGKRPISVAVNLSLLQLMDSEFLPQLDRILRETKLPPHLLELELTESMLIKETNKVRLILEQIQERGISIAVDDFGTGYSSLTHLKMFPINTLKIDRTFIYDFNGDYQQATFFQALAAMAKMLDMKVVAEGIETPEQANLCLESKCDLIQGFHYFRPMEIGPLEALLAYAPNVAVKSAIPG